MYLARTEQKDAFTYSLRESYVADGYLQSRELFQLGSDPGNFIKYPGGHAYYFKDELIEALENQGVTDIDDRLEELLEGFIKPEIRKVIGHFAHRGIICKTPSNEHIPTEQHLFDKRRLLFLKSGIVDQGAIRSLPRKLFCILDHKSRDEIEQYFLLAERILKPAELKIYTYVIFDLQRHFSSPLAKRFPAAMDGIRLDEHFIAAVCRLNDDHNFWRGLSRGAALPAYLIRYIIMYFDNPFAEEDFMAAYIRDFMRNRRSFRFPPQPGPAMGLKAAAHLLGLAVEDLRKMDPTVLTRHYRKMAIKLHPDQGGNQDQFIKVTEAYQSALQRLRKK